MVLRTRKRPLASIDEILAATPKPPALVEIENKLAALRDRRDGLFEQNRGANESLREENKHEIGPLLAEIRAERTRVEAEITSTRKRHATLRAEHGSALAAAMEPVRSVAEREFRECYTALLCSWRSLDRIHDVLRSAGAKVPSTTPANKMEPMIRRLLFSAVGDPEGFREIAALAA